METEETKEFFIAGYCIRQIKYDKESGQVTFSIRTSGSPLTELQINQASQMIGRYLSSEGFFDQLRKSN